MKWLHASGVVLPTLPFISFTGELIRELLALLMLIWSEIEPGDTILGVWASLKGSLLGENVPLRVFVPVVCMLPPPRYWGLTVSLNLLVRRGERLRFREEKEEVGMRSARIVVIC